MPFYLKSLLDDFYVYWLFAPEAFNQSGILVLQTAHWNQTALATTYIWRIYSCFEKKQRFYTTEPFSVYIKPF